MSDKKPTSKKQDTTPQSKPKQAPKGKVKGQGEVKPASSTRAVGDTARAIAPTKGSADRTAEKTANLAKGYRVGAEAFKAANATALKEAYEAGREASETGTPGKPPAEYSDLEVRAWFEGYKSHANPNAEGQVEGIEKGYRSKY